MSQDELKIKVVLDDAEFKEQFIRLRRELEQEGEYRQDRDGQPGPEGPQGPPGPSGEVTVNLEGGDGGGGINEGTREWMRNVDQQLLDVRRSQGADPDESKVTVNMLIEQLKSNIAGTEMGMQWGMVESDTGEMEYSPEVLEIISQLQIVGRRRGFDEPIGRVRREGPGGMSDSSGMRSFRRAITGLAQNLPDIHGDRLGTPETIQRELDDAFASVSRGATDVTGSSLMHPGMEKFMAAFSEMIKGSDEGIELESRFPSGGVADFVRRGVETWYLGEAKTSSAGRATARQITGYYEDVVIQKFLDAAQGEGGAELASGIKDLMGKDIPTLRADPRAYERIQDAVIKWGNVVGPQRVRDRMAGSLEEPGIKGFTISPHSTGNLGDTVGSMLRASAITRPFTGRFGERSDIEFEDITIPREALAYVNGSIDAMTAEGEEPTPDDWQRFLMQWVSQTDKRSGLYRQMKGILNVMGVTPEQLNATLLQLNTDYQENYAQVFASGERPTPQERVSMWQEQVLQPAMEQTGAERFNIREAFRFFATEAGGQLIPTGWEPQGAGVSIGRTISAGTRHMVRALTDEQVIESMIGYGADEVIAEVRDAVQEETPRPAVDPRTPGAFTCMRCGYPSDGPPCPNCGASSYIAGLPSPGSALAQKRLMHVGQIERARIRAETIAQYGETSAEVFALQQVDVTRAIAGLEEQRDRPGRIPEEIAGYNDHIATLRQYMTERGQEVGDYMESRDRTARLFASQRFGEPREQQAVIDAQIAYREWQEGPGSLGIGMDIDPREYSDNMEKIAIQMGFKGGEGLTPYAELQKYAANKEAQRSNVIDIMSAVVLRFKEQSGAILNEPRKQDIISRLRQTDIGESNLEQLTYALGLGGSEALKQNLDANILPEQFPDIIKSITKLLDPRNPARELLDDGLLNELTNAQRIMSIWQRASAELEPMTNLAYPWM